MVLLAVVLVVAGAMLAGYVVSGMTEQSSVVVLTRDIPIGTQLNAADVKTAQVEADSTVAKIPGSQVREVVGRVAAVDLRAGAILTPTQLTSGLSPRPGQQVVPIALKLAQLPARELHPGDQLLVVATPAAQGQGEAPAGATALPADTRATVDQVSAPDADGTVRVDLTVESQVGPALVKQASTGRLGIVIVARGPR